MLTALIVSSCLAVCIAAPQSLGGYRQRQGGYPLQQQQQLGYRQQLASYPQQQRGFGGQQSQQFRAPPPPTTTPVPILRQVSNTNDDGSYTYGYEAGDGSFKLETRNANGEVFGKYGYIDTNGELKTVEYGASQLGFNPSGKGITVAPPTLVDETLNYDYDYNYNQVPVAPVRAPPKVLHNFSPRINTLFQIKP